MSQSSQEVSQEGPEEFFTFFIVPLYPDMAGLETSRRYEVFCLHSFEILGNSQKLSFTGDFICEMRATCPLASQVNVKTEDPGGMLGTACLHADCVQMS